MKSQAVYLALLDAARKILTQELKDRNIKPNPDKVTKGALKLLVATGTYAAHRLEHC